MKPFIMRSYLKFTDGTPVLKYAVARYETGIVVAHDLDCEEAEKYRDQLNKDDRRARLQATQMRADAEFAERPAPDPVKPDTVSYPAQPPRLGSDIEIEVRADEIVKAIEHLADWRKREVLDTVVMRLEYQLRLLKMGKR